MEYWLSKKKKLESLKKEMLKYCLESDRETFLGVFIDSHFFVDASVLATRTRRSIAMGITMHYIQGWTLKMDD